MKTAAEYRQHADECRALARQVSEGVQRKQLLDMARTWDDLAEDRQRLLHHNPELDTSKPPASGQLPSKP